ncbi:NYN domain-containing protein [Clostridium ihumii]|uniref:NYN domain-containing protein n=1 Tax=Clostridium ihumii TaxID=1470356 RepID=UPI0005581A7B|nr:NYN domain-containing protein [Clostridium ihumii]
MKRIFVDGYNVINSWPELRNIKDYSYESARAKLLDIMLNYAAFCGCKIEIVYDAHLVKGACEKKEKRDKVTVIFTKEGETADMYIEKKVNMIGKKFEVYVVTSDSIEQQITFQRGANRVSSLEFYHQVTDIDKKINKKYEKNYSENRNLFSDMLDNDILEIFEKMRRGK